MEYQLSHNTIEDLKKLGFEINWTLLKLGYKGDVFLPSSISKKEIINYAESIVEETNNDFIIRLLIFDSEYEFLQILEALEKQETKDKVLQYRKLRVYIVNKVFQNISFDYFEGLMDLTELWCSLGFPIDSPHVIQGINNSYSPKDYFTPEIYNLVIKLHEEWIKKEIVDINSLENNI